MRWLALVAGVGLLALAVVLFPRVTDTREGLIAEVVTLLGGGAGFVLVTYWFFARERPTAPAPRPSRPAQNTPHKRSNRDLLLGAGGIALALVLVGGLAFSAGPMFAGFGLALLLPMLAGSVYLCVRYLRASP